MTYRFKMILMTVICGALALSFVQGARDTESSAPRVQSPSTRLDTAPVPSSAPTVAVQASDPYTFQQEREAETDAYLADLQRRAAAEEEAARVEADRVAAEEAATRKAAGATLPGVRSSSVAATNYPPSLYPCGGDLPPCRVAERESGGSYTVVNWGGCGGANCYGKWQFGGFWAGKLGLPLDIINATPEQQDNAARILWNNGAGCSNWSAC